LELYADTFDLWEHIRFEHHVLRVRPLIDDKWEFIVKNFAEESNETFIFDAVLVCSGFEVPWIQKISGQDVFKGKQMHSHLYHSSKDYQDQTVLVIGGGPSGIDLTFDLRSTAKRIVWSHHMDEPLDKKVKVTLPANVSERPDVVRFSVNGAEFLDGTSEEFQTVIYATGYDYAFPFLSIDCGLSCDDKYVYPLYKHCININHPSFAIIGVPYFAVAMPLFDLQVRFCLTFMTFRKQLPSKEKMLEQTEREMNDQWERGLKKHKAHFLGIEKHAEYYEDLAATAGIEGLKPVVAKIFNRSFGNFYENFNNFRTFNFTVIDDENFVMTQSNEEIKN
jgi:hypothetical protein